jgi:hypothetical protein
MSDEHYACFPINKPPVVSRIELGYMIVLSFFDIYICGKMIMASIIGGRMAH